MKRPADDGPPEESARYGGREPGYERERERGGYEERGGGGGRGRGGRRGGRGYGGRGGRGPRGPPMPLDGPLPLDGPMGPPPMYSPGPRGGPSGPRGPPPGPPIDLQKEPNITQEIIVPRKRTGVILGPGGQTASEIRRHCRCQLHVRKDTRPDDTQTVEISGSLMQVRAGVERVREILLAEDKDMVVSILPDAFSYIDVLPEMVGYVLGSRGSTVKTLKEKTGTQIQITDINPETGLQAILIKGKPENITEAHHTVVKMLERYDPRRTRPPPIGGPPAPLMGPSGYGPPPGYGHDPYGPPDLDAGPMGPPGFGPPPYGYADELDRYGPPALDAPPPYMRGGRDRYTPEDPWAPPRTAPQYPGSASGYSAQPAAAAPAATTAAPVAAAPADPNAPPGSTPQILILQPDGTYRAAQIMLPGYTQPAAGAQPVVTGSQPLAVPAAATAVQPQPAIAYTSAAMQQPQYHQPAPQQYLPQPAQQQAVPQQQPQASPAPAQPQPAAPVALPAANGTAAVAAPATAAAAPPTSGSMTLQQMQQYYSMYAQLYQQAQQQQLQQQPAPQQ